MYVFQKIWSHYTWIGNVHIQQNSDPYFASIRCLCCVCADLLHTNPFRSERCVIPAPNIRNKIPDGCPQIFSENYCHTSPLFPLSITWGSVVGGLWKVGVGQRGSSSVKQPERSPPSTANKLLTPADKYCYGACRRSVAFFNKIAVDTCYRRMESPFSLYPLLLLTPQQFDWWLETKVKVPERLNILVIK